MLALMTVAAGAGGAGTVVFDEVDAGLGGATARIVGEKLRALAEERQALCITHLPQVASQGARHFRVVKESGAGETHVRRSSGSSAGRWSASCAACSGPTPTTSPRAGTPKGCSRRRRIRHRPRPTGQPAQKPLYAEGRPDGALPPNTTTRATEAPQAETSGAKPTHARRSRCAARRGSGGARRTS